MGIKIITPPSAEQVTLEVARLELRLDDDGDSPPSHPLDPMITRKIASARGFCEDLSGRALAPQVVELALDAFRVACDGGNQAIELPLPPVSSIVSVKYVDAAGVEQTMAEDAYVLDDYQEPSWLLPAAGTLWPTTKAVVNAVKIRIACGYSLLGDSPQTNPLPEKYRQAIIVLMVDMVKNDSGSPTDDALRAARSLMALTRVGLGV